MMRAILVEPYGPPEREVGAASTAAPRTSRSRGRCRRGLGSCTRRLRSPSILQSVVGGHGQELLELLREHELEEELLRLLSRVDECGLVEHVVGREPAAAEPLPHLRARDLGG